MTETARALFYTGPGTAEIRPVPTGDGPVAVRTLWSGISRGTERLVSRGAVPDSEWGRMRAPFQIGDFPFPVAYGYAAVGVVDDGPADVIGRTVFALAPHQTRFAVPADAVIPVPDAVPARRAVLAANMETAVNALWDGKATAGQAITIVGGGVVGLLIASLAATFPGTRVTVVDIDPARREIAERLGAGFSGPEVDDREADLVFHTSASSAGLQTAIERAGPEATIVEASWFGAAPATIPLGGAFHSKRLRLVSSQVGAVAASQRPRWSHRRRLALALRLLDDVRLDSLITEEIAFDGLPERISTVLAPGGPGLAAVVRYD